MLCCRRDRPSYVCSCTTTILTPILFVAQPCGRLLDSFLSATMDKDHLAPSTPEHHNPPVGPSSESVNDYFTAQPITPMADPVMAYGPKRKPRKLVLCFDGTGNKFRGDDSDSSILKIYRMLDRTASDQSEIPKSPNTHNHPNSSGIGTYVVSNQLGDKSMRRRIGSWYAKAKDSMIGSSFDQHVVGGYRFLMRFYSMGDELYLFGFSRGSYIARFLAEMLDYVGLLSHGNEEMVSFAWKAFSQWQCRRTDNSPEGVEKRHAMYRFLKGFRETFSRPVRRIRFLGLFDTVNSVPRFEAAWMERSKFPYTARSSAKVIRHAVSIDERRAKFRQDLIYQSNNRKKHPAPLHDQARQKMHEVHDKYRGKSATNAPNNGEAGRKKATGQRGRNPNLTVPGRGGDEDEPVRYRARSRSTRAERSRSRAAAAAKRAHDDAASDTTSHAGPPTNYAESECSDEDDQDIEEVWFAGGHGDVGGGWDIPPDGKSASHVPLAWMVREAMRAGLSFDMNKVMAMGCADCEEELEDEYEDAANERSMQGASDNDALGEAPKQPVDVPDIMIRSPSGSSPTMLSKSVFEHHDDTNENEPKDPSPANLIAASPSEKHPRTHFHHLMHKAHTAQIHDSLSYGGGLSRSSVLAWKIMEYLPFRRMDLRSDGSWAPIRWPLPCGEVRDIPRDARVHGSVIRRMREDGGYRPGNLIVGGGGRGCRVAPEEYGIGEWVCVAEEGDVIGEVWMRKSVVEGSEGEGGK
ncbi:hypothetical protein CONLIGDRAFT_707645 [Coniochaeta ligniaria NRRL 30616]|uniref:T6SS Phospholipase effector Tle1-like catalytic domain-containing protein n=1 Tax=Coniochaeta ligniaria NRRL 30616 TaxID=1408157 RepID=A0A1J7IHN3_9PEZI|nr:hypothetical protein CONLIGDRAFT_707645 [Coniochaeta ligniaria NRRL 30616]